MHIINRFKFILFNIIQLYVFIFNTDIKWYCKMDRRFQQTTVAKDGLISRCDGVVCLDWMMDIEKRFHFGYSDFIYVIFINYILCKLYGNYNEII